MAAIVVVGSGPSGVHFALTALRKGHRVTMLDVGHVAAEAPLDLPFDEPTARAADPVRYFLGSAYEGVVVPGREQEYYGFPPSKDHVFRRPPGFEVEARGFEPLFSFGRGGLAEAWTGGCYPLDDGDLADFPFDYADLAPYYAEIARRIGVTGLKDDLAQFLPVHEHLLEPLRLDLHSAHLQTAYERARETINGRLGCWLGRSRVAVLTAPREGRGACTYSGRCLWGCPTRALYTPSVTLEECQRYPNFTYRPSSWVQHFSAGADRRLQRAVYRSLPDGLAHEIAADRFVLAAGTLGSSSIYLNSVREATGQTGRLDGLMDNRQVLVPFLSPRFIGRPSPARSYQYHQLALGLPGQHARDYVHGQITTLKTALAHPIIQALPLDLRTATFVFRAVRAGLGIVNVNLSDTRRQGNTVTVRAAADGQSSTLAIEYAPPPDESHRLAAVLRRVRQVLRRLGCIVPPGLAHVRPMGASVHYAGTVPMSRVRGDHTASRHCRSHFFDNLWFVDGTSFPFLPAKNLTFTLMANAVRVAEEDF